MPDFSAPPQPQTRITCWVDTTLLEDFHRHFPRHGAITSVVRAALNRAVANATKGAKELLDAAGTQS